MIRTLLLDVDGVIADFVGHAIAQLAPGRAADLYATWPRGEWNVGTVMGVESSLFWATVDTPDFWATIPAYAKSHDFVRALLALSTSHGVGSVLFATSSGGSTAFPAARTVWLRNFCKKAGVPQIPVIIFQHILHKAVAGGPGALLIDDSAHGIAEFKAKGGRTVCVPRVWNNGTIPENGDVYALVLDQVRVTLQAEGEENA